MTETPFWEQPDTVERFAGREPDHRLQALARDFVEPGATRVLDLGCAGGRNTVFLAERGFDVIARDASGAMLAETRSRLAAVLGRKEAERRARRGRMDDLAGIPDGSLHLIVALGVWHEAGDRAEWDRTLAEALRTLRPGGRVLLANHSPEFRKADGPLPPVPGEAHVYRRGDRRAFLLHADELDREMAAHGFERLAPTETVRRETKEGGLRVTVNGLYGRPAPPGAAG